MKVRKLDMLKESDLVSFGLNGYKTDKIYHVSKKCESNKINMELEIEQLDSLYEKEWKQNPDSFDYFKDIIDQGLSIGCFENDRLIGFALIGYYAWNKSMWIENIRVAEPYHGKGVGKKLINELVNQGKLKKARILGLETQNTNYPAIEFYKKCGFEISGIDFGRYPQRENDRQQVAVLMQIEL